MTIPSDFWPALAALVALIALVGGGIAFADSRIKGVAAAESKARHDLRGEMNVVVARLEVETKRVLDHSDTKHEALRDWAAPRIELGAMETRMNEKIAVLSTSVDRQMGELKVDSRGISEKITGLTREIGGLSALMTQALSPTKRSDP